MARQSVVYQWQDRSVHLNEKDKSGRFGNGKTKLYI